MFGSNPACVHDEYEKHARSKKSTSPVSDHVTKHTTLGPLYYAFFCLIYVHLIFDPCMAVELWNTAKSYHMVAAHCAGLYV